jgi:hypothetical protein
LVLPKTIGYAEVAMRADAPSENERRALLRSLMEVGPSKPVGYLPLHTIEELVQLTPEAVAAASAACGLATAQFGPDACCIKSGALYVYDREVLAALLEETADAVRAAGLPLDPDRFVVHIASVWFEKDHPSYPIIATAFGDSS